MCVQVLDVSDHAPLVRVVFLGADDSGRVSRRARPGATVARVSVTDADQHDNVTVSLRTQSVTDPTVPSEPFRRPSRTESEPFLLTSHGRQHVRSIIS